MPSNTRLRHFDTMWGIRPEAFEAIESAMAVVGEEALAEAMASAGRPGNEDAGYQIRDTVAVIPITGTIHKGKSFWSYFYGGGNLTRLTSVVENALADHKVGSILLDIDSPGGTVNGLDAFSDLIYAAREVKPVAAFASGMMASAAYWIGSAAQQVVVEKTTDVGSIGVLYVHWDTSKEDEAYGWKRTLITAGEYKGVGNDIEPLSSRDRGVIQSELDYVYDIFIDTVAINRGVSADTVRADMADGRIFIGQQAVDAGLADKVGSFQDALNMARELPNGSGESINIKASTEREDIMDFEKFKAEHPELFAQVRQEGVDSVDIEASVAEAVSSEAERVLGFVGAYFGAEAGEKFKTVVATGVTLGQYQAIVGDSAPGQVDNETDGAEALQAVQDKLLAAIENAGPGNPGAGGGSDGDKGFDAMVEAIVTQRKCSRTEAMKEVAKNHPEVHAAYLKAANPVGSA